MTFQIVLLTALAQMAVNLYPHQELAIKNLRSGSILCGGVGTGKSRTAIAYYYLHECKGGIKVNGKGSRSEMKTPKDLYIITTAKKRDSLEWEKECAPFMISTERDASISGVKVVIDSWNNISKYVSIKNSFFIFDEQRLVGSGTWVKSFLKIAKANNWILLSATPGDTWTDYIPVFLANGFYKNRTEFLREHAVYSRFTKYPKIEKFIGNGKLLKLKNNITVTMSYDKPTTGHDIIIDVPYDRLQIKMINKNRWNPLTNEPIKNASELCYLMRKVVNSDPSRLLETLNVFNKHKRLIVFYNFDYELEILRHLQDYTDCPIHEWNGHKHQEVPKGKEWLYLVQYTAGAEGWNCIDTDAILFYSQNYSYKIMIQSAGRIDRLNTSYRDLYYYHLISKSPIDLAISRSLKVKKNFNANKFITF